ncbi:thiol reductant ABC exporter subunit CydC [Propionibacterium sp.]|uniref:thiol reductant ABC exporter subunit CydC n=1 Tax=Propionibacterium sp. TaxID=1977903 RepID=UPI0039E9E3EC
MHQAAVLIRRLIGSVPRGGRRLGMSILLAFFAAGSSVGLMGLSGWLLSRAAEHPPVMYLLAASVGVRFFGIGRAVWRYLERLVGHDLALRMEGSLRETVYARLTGTTLLGRRQGDLLVRCTADVDSVMDVVVRVVVPFTSSVLVIIGTAAMLAYFCPPAALIVLVMSLLAGLVMPWAGARLSLRADQVSVPLRGELAAQVHEVVRCASDIVAFGAQHEALEELRRTDAALGAAEARGAWTRGVASAGQMLACGFSVTGALLVGGPAVASGALLGRALALVVLTPLALHESFGDLGQSAQTFTRTRTALGRVIALLTEPPVGHGDRVVDPTGGSRELDVEHLDAGWPDGPVIVRDVSMHLPPGGRLALTGSSGVGKTTVAATIMGLIDPHAGQVHAPAAIGYLAQDAHIFATSVAENVRIGDKDATDAQVRAALDEAGLCTMDLQRVVGEQGATLSGGEARRLALARVLVGRSADRLIILDEPTEHLDNETAEAIMADLWAGVGDAAVLVISHDPGLVAACPVSVDLESHRAASAGPRIVG